MDAAGYNGETYIGPAVAGFDLAFLNTTFQNQVLGYFDAVSVHPFRSGKPETVLTDYLSLTALITKSNPNKPQSIISGRWGWSTCGPCSPSSDLQIALSTQGKFLARQWLANTLGDVRVSIYEEWKDGPSANDPESNFGSIEYGSAYTPKPAFVAASALQIWLPPTSYAFRVRIDVGDPDVYVLAYSPTGSSFSTAYAVWKTSVTSTCDNVPTDQRTDCGFVNITQGECSWRECCYQSGSNPPCYFQPTSASISFSSSSSKTGVCFKVVNYLGNTVNNNLCPQNDQLTVTASDGPLYLTALSY